MDRDKILRFADAFVVQSGCRHMCKCGRIFYEPHGGWDWTDGEIEALSVDSKATSIDHPVGLFHFEGADYVWDCTCWHKRMERVVAWVDAHSTEIAKYLNAEKKNAELKASLMPTVER